jgi:hypothetical protein
MQLDAATARAVQELAHAGARHGRVPAPVPEADPWEDGDPLDPRLSHVVVEFPGTPSVVVQLHRDGEDLVVVEDVVELDVPRRDTPAVVEELLAGRARRRILVRGALRSLLAVWLHNPLPAELIVQVGRGAVRRTYTAPIVLAIPISGWLATLPTVDDAGGRPDAPPRGSAPT